MDAQPLDAIPSLSRGVRFRRLPDGEGVLLVPEGVVKLNASAAAVVELIDARRTMREIALELEARYEPDGNGMRADIRGLIDGLAAQTWISLRGGGEA